MKTNRLWVVPLLFVLALASCGPLSQGSFSRSLQVSGPVELEVQSGAGSVTVHTGRDTTVSVSAAVRARGSFSGMSAEEKVRRLRENPPIVQNGNTIHIGKVDSELVRNVFIDYDLSVPPQTRLTLRTGAGSQYIHGTELSLEAWSGAGNIIVDSVGGDVEIRTGAGSIEVRSPKGSLNVESGAGSVRANGDPKQDWRIQVGAGGIRIKVPAKASFDLEAESGFGGVNVSPGFKLDGSVTSRRVYAKVGQGGPTVHLTSGAGSINVE